MIIAPAFLDYLYVIHGRRNKVILIDALQGCERERENGAFVRRCTGTSYFSRMD